MIELERSSTGPSLIPLRVNDLKQFPDCPRMVFYNTLMPVERKSTVKMERGKDEEFNAQAFYTLFTSSPVWCCEKCQSKRRIQGCERPERSAWNCQRESLGFTCETTSWWSIADNFQDHAPNSTSLIREQVHRELKDSWHYRAPATTNRRKANKFLRTPYTRSENSFRDSRCVVEVIETPCPSTSSSSNWPPPDKSIRCSTLSMVAAPLNDTRWKLICRSLSSSALSAGLVSA